VVRAHPTVPLFNDIDVFAARILMRIALAPRLMRSPSERDFRDFVGSRMRDAQSRSFLACGRRFGSDCVLRTASVSISRSSAFVFGGARGVFCHWVMDTIWGCGREN
jgi:hypothetical protein